MTGVESSLVRCSWITLLSALASGCLAIPGERPCDEDGDGYYAAACADERAYPADCNDADANVFPGALDVAGSDRSEDCVGDAAGIAAGDGQPRLSTGTMGASRIVTSDWLALTLGDQAGFEPTDLRVTRAGDRNLLYTNAAQTERFAGIAIWPDYFAHTPNAEAALEPLAVNGAVARFRVTWSVGGATNEAEGTTIYTVHPDGRIHFDQDVQIVGVLPDVYWFATYIAMNPNRITHVRPPSETIRIIGAEPAQIFYQPLQNNQGFICAWDETTRDRLTWVYQAPIGEDPLIGPRASESGQVGMANHQVAMQFDWVRDGAVLQDLYRSNVMVRADVAGETDPCAGGTALASVMHTPPQLMVSAPAGHITDSAGDDDQDGYNEGGGFHELSAAGAESISIEIVNDAVDPAPTATLRLRGLTWTRPPIVTLGRALEHGREYLAEADEGGDGGWLFFASPLPDGETLTVRAAASL